MTNPDQSRREQHGNPSGREGSARVDDPKIIGLARVLPSLAPPDWMDEQLRVTALEQAGLNRQQQTPVRAATDGRLREASGAATTNARTDARAGSKAGRQSRWQAWMPWAGSLASLAVVALLVTAQAPSPTPEPTPEAAEGYSNQQSSPSATAQAPAPALAPAPAPAPSPPGAAPAAAPAATHAQPAKTRTPAGGAVAPLKPAPDASRRVQPRPPVSGPDNLGSQAADTLSVEPKARPAENRAGERSAATDGIDAQPRGTSSAKAAIDNSSNARSDSRVGESSSAPAVPQGPALRARAAAGVPQSMESSATLSVERCLNELERLRQRDQRDAARVLFKNCAQKFPDQQWPRAVRDWLDLPAEPARSQP